MASGPDDSHDAALLSMAREIDALTGEDRRLALLEYHRSPWWDGLNVLVDGDVGRITLEARELWDATSDEEKYAHLSNVIPFDRDGDERRLDRGEDPLEDPLEDRPKTLPMIWFDDIRPQLNGNWIVKNVIPAEAFVTVIGHPGCGKSFFALDLCLHIASGRQWQGRKVKKGLVIYLAAEGQRGQQNRVEAWRRHHGETGLGFAMIPVAVNLRDTGAELPMLVAKIKEAISVSGQELAVLAVDTLNRTFGGGDENGPDMSAYVANVGRLQAEFGCTAMVVHHVPKNNEVVSERGHGSLRGAIETSLIVNYNQDTGDREVFCKKQKDGEDGWKIPFRLMSLDLGEDEDGAMVTSCVVVTERDGKASDQAGEQRKNAIAAADNDIFLRCLDIRNSQKRPVSQSPNSPVNFAPKVFAEMVESKGIGVARLTQALERLYRLKAIDRGYVGTYKGEGKNAFGLIRVGQNGSKSTSDNSPENSRILPKELSEIEQNQSDNSFSGVIGEIEQNQSDNSTDNSPITPDNYPPPKGGSFRDFPPAGVLSDEWRGNPALNKGRPSQDGWD